MMLFWIISAVLTAAVLLYILAPLARTGQLWAAYGLTTLISVLSLGLYSWLGNPDLPDQPIALRQARQAQALSEIEAGIVKLRDALTVDPDDAAGWALLASSEIALGHEAAAAEAFSYAAQLSKGDTLDDYERQASAARIAGQYKAGKAAWLAGDRTGMEASWRPLLDQLPDNAPIRADVLQKLDGPR